MAALMGEDSFNRTPRDIFNRLILGIRAPPNAYMTRGLAMEPVIRTRYVEETGAELEPHPGVVEWGVCFAASVDDLRVRAGTRGVVDYKSASNSASSMRKWGKGMLPSYVWQLRLYMAVFDRSEADLFVAFGKDAIEDGEYRSFDITETRLYTVQRDAEAERRMIEVAERFWHDHIIPKRPPLVPGEEDLRSTRVADTTLSAADLAALEALNAQP